MPSEQELDQAIQQWRVAQERERQARDERRELEDRVIALSELNTDSKGVRRITPEFKATCKQNVSIDANKLQEIAREQGTFEHLGTICTWTPKINQKAWDAAPEELTAPLLAAITRKPGRPSFTFTEKKDK